MSETRRKRRTLDEIRVSVEQGNWDFEDIADLRQYASELAELRRLLEPARMDTKERDWTDGPKTVNDLLCLMTCYMADYMPTEAIPNDEYFGAWERVVRPFIEKLFADNARLAAESQHLSDMVHFLANDMTQFDLANVSQAVRKTREREAAEAAKEGGR